MSADPRRTQPFCTPDCYRECQCSRWPDMVDRWGNPVNHGQGGTPAILPCYYLTFDGANDLINLAGVVVTPPYTVSLWTRRHAIGAEQVIMAGGPVLYCELSAANTTNYMHTNNTGGNANVTVAWSHLAWTIPVGPATVTTYRDGVDVTALAAAAGAAQSYTVIGAYVGGIVLWHGDLAIIGIAPAVLNIPALWAAGTLHRPLDPAAFTIACWNGRQEGGAGVTLIDEAIGNNGTFLGAGEPAWGGLMSVSGPAGWTD
jgi:hypothetical protein